jgi:hypothetical protein
MLRDKLAACPYERRAAHLPSLCHSLSFESLDRASREFHPFRGPFSACAEMIGYGWNETRFSAHGSRLSRPSTAYNRVTLKWTFETLGKHAGVSVVVRIFRNRDGSRQPFCGLNGFRAH